MPLNWMSSSFMVTLILAMIIIMYSLKFYKMLSLKDNMLSVCQMNWWW